MALSVFKLLRSFLFLGVFLLAEGVIAAEYRVEAEDVLKITVFDEPDLSIDEARVSSDGIIALPLIDEISVKGLTTEQIARRVEKKLADGYLKKPRVSVTIFEYRQFFVHGAVEKPGGYSYQTGLTVERAIVLAGGLTERASDRKITLVREVEPEKVISVNMNQLVRPGDVISIGESFF